ERARQLPHHTMWLAHVLERHDVDTGVECPIAKGQRRQVRDGVQAAIVPGRVADRQVDAAIPRRFKKFGVAALTGAGVQNALPRPDSLREARQRLFNGRLKMQNVSAQERRKAIGDRGVPHVFLRASIMMVEPARHAASMTVNGTDATTRAPYSRS